MTKAVALLLFALVASLVGMMIVTNVLPDKTTQGLIFLGILAVFLVLALVIPISVRRGYRKGKRVFAQNLEEWQDTWACLKCGASWTY